MSRSHSTIPFHDLKFLDDVPSLRSVEERLRKFLKRPRKAAQERAVAEGRMTEDDCLYDYELVANEDTRRIKRRAMRVLERVHSSTGMDLPGKCGEHQLRNQEVFYGKRKQTDAGVSA